MLKPSRSDNCREHDREKVNLPVLTIIPAKLCVKCKEKKPPAAFGKDCRRNDGLFPYCKSCRQKDPAKYEERKRNHAAGLRKCVDCQQWIDISLFGSNRAHKDGLHNHCRVCALAQSKRYIANNLEKVKARDKAYRTACPEKRSAFWKAYYIANSHRLILKAMQKRREYNPALDTLTGPEWIQILVSQNGLCAKCKGRFNSKFIPTRDHILPITQGGYLTKENSQALCRRCNASKGTKTIRY